MTRSARTCEETRPPYNARSSCKRAGRVRAILPLSVKALATVRAACWALVAIATTASCTRKVPTIVEPSPPLRSEPIRIEKEPSSREFSRLFCGVLAHAPGKWGDCARYLWPAGTPGPVNESFESPYRILVVPGVFGQCIDAIVRPFEDARRHLATAHGIDIEYVSIPALGSSTYNAQRLAEYLDQRFSGGEMRRYIAFGYSKGASDILEAVGRYEIAQRAIAAVVTVAGSVMGSRLAEGVPRGLLRTLERWKRGVCEAGDGRGIESLRRSVRIRAVAEMKLPEHLRTYSIAAISDASNTSAVLMDGWNQLHAYSLEEDGQVIHEDAIVPDATYLGFARADHWAVALPFEDAAELDPTLGATLRRLVDRNHYPRVALFEAVLRFVIADLATKN